jgi:Fic family protein
MNRSQPFNDLPTLPPAVELAIHPFTDGNGRTGRIINILFLVEKGLLEIPILFLSNYILRTRKDYYAGLRNVTEQGAWVDWILYILEGIDSTATETQDRVKGILDLMKKTKKIIQTDAPNIYSKDLVEVLFKHPYCKIKFLEDAKIAKRQTASLYLQALEKMGLLRSLPIGREQYYINDPLLKILTK